MISGQIVTEKLIRLLSAEDQATEAVLAQMYISAFFIR
jgi:predicted 3-demethylubiquinone-9 3-methyltransferase (glyoxalase superfamily)